MAIGAPAARRAGGRAARCASYIRYSAFEPGSVEVAPGETVRFVLENPTRSTTSSSSATRGCSSCTKRGTEAHHPPRPGEISIPAGTTRSTTITFAPIAGELTLFGCHLPGHYAYGMAGRDRVRVTR